MYGQNSWNGFETAGGCHVGSATGLINFFYASKLTCGLHQTATIQQLQREELA